MRYLSFIFVVLFASTTWSAYETYDEIVDKLSQYSRSEVKTKNTYKAPTRGFSTAHIGIGFTQTFYDADEVALDAKPRWVDSYIRCGCF